MLGGGAKSPIRYRLYAPTIHLHSMRRLQLLTARVVTKANLARHRPTSRDFITPKELQRLDCISLHVLRELDAKQIQPSTENTPNPICIPTTTTHSPGIRREESYERVSFQLPSAQQRQGGR